MPVRIYLTGRVAVEADNVTIDERELPGRQGRLALVYLGRPGQRPVPRHELAEVLWQGSLPGSWEVALSAVISKLRRVLDRFGVEGRRVLIQSSGNYQLCLPTGSWVDIERAAGSIDAAEVALRRGAAKEAWGDAEVAAAIARRPLLPGEEAEWIDIERRNLQRIHLRALVCLAQSWLETGELSLARRVAEEAIASDPFSEQSYQTLMHIHLRGNDKPQVLRVYESCRRILRDELGIEPSPQTEAIYLKALR